jgi:hypothetical protein
MLRDEAGTPTNDDFPLSVRFSIASLQSCNYGA